MTFFISKPKLFSVIFITLFLSPHVLADDLNPTSTPNPDQLLTTVAITLFAVAFVLIYIVFYYTFYYLFPNRAANRPDPDVMRPVGLAGRGLDLDVLHSFPVFMFSEVSGLRRPGDDGPLECAVCLSLFEGDETLRLLPACDHVFHVQCVDTWLKDHSTCPYCRAELGGLSAKVFSGRVIEEVEELVNEARNDVVEESQRSWKGGKYWRSNSTGHVAGGERFMLILPEEVRNDIVTGNHSRSRSCVVNVTNLDVIF